MDQENEILTTTGFSVIASIGIEGYNPETGKPDTVKGFFNVQCKVDYVPNGLSWFVDLELISPSNRKKQGGITDSITTKDWGHQETVRLDYEDGYLKFTYELQIVDRQDNENVKVE
ncbi:MAG: hypothetical protein F4Z14_01610 [Gammaproteobacteria bacterium]|nr:hypothetical protein [Gammaproteobacteria bacterium]